MNNTQTQIAQKTTFSLQDHLDLEARKQATPDYPMNDRDWQIYTWAEDQLLHKPIVGRNPHSLKDAIGSDIKNSAHELLDTLIQKAELYALENPCPRSALQLEATRKICEAYWARLLTITSDIDTPQYPQLSGRSSLLRLPHELQTIQAQAAIAKAKDKD